MNRDVFVATLRERLSHPVRLAAFLGFLLFPLAIAAVDDRTDSSLAFFHPILVVALAGGVVGLEVSSGTLALAFTRPVSRSTYVLSKWGAVAAIGGAASLLQLLAVCEIYSLRPGVPPLAAGEILARAAERLLAAAGTSALFVLLSVASSGLTDLAVWSLGTIGAQTAKAAGTIAGRPFLTRLGENLQLVLAPGWGLWKAAAEGSPWLIAAAAVAITVLALGLACFVAGRRELSYAEIRV